MNTVRMYRHSKWCEIFWWVLESYALENLKSSSRNKFFDWFPPPRDCHLTSVLVYSNFQIWRALQRALQLLWTERVRKVHSAGGHYSICSWEVRHQCRWYDRKSVEWRQLKSHFTFTKTDSGFTAAKGYDSSPYIRWGTYYILGRVSVYTYWDHALCVFNLAAQIWY